MKFLTTFVVLSLFFCNPLWSANLGFTGGETGDTAELTSSTNVTLSSTVKNNGTYSYKVDGTTGNGQIAHTAVDHVRVAFYYRTNSVATISIVASFDNGATLLAEVRLISATNNIRLFSGTKQVLGTTTIVVDTWYFIEFRYQKGTGSDAVAEFKINGTVEATITDSNETLQASELNIESTGSGVTNYFDDIRLRDDAYPGAGVVSGLRPDAVGDEDNFTNGFAQIDDDPVDDATLREAPASGPIPFLNDVGALADVGTVNQVRVKVRALQTSGAGREHYIRWLKPGGTAENSADLLLTVSVAFFSYTPSDQPTTQAHIDDMQAGMSQNTAGGRLAQCTELWIMVDHTLAAGGTRQRGHVMD